MKQENEFVLPKAWSIKITSENVDIIQEFKSKTKHKDHASMWKYCEYNGIGSNKLSFEEITFNQFKEHVLKEIPKPEYDPKDVAFKNDVYSNSEFNGETFETKCGQIYTEKKKIIGYKLIKPEYREAAKLIAFSHIGEKIKYYTNNFETIGVKNGAPCKKALEEAGVLSLWFEPIFSESITLKSGVKLSEDDIAEVKELIEFKRICEELAK